MGLESSIGLLVAITELQAVRAVTKAINANLPKDGPLGTIRPSSAQLYARPRRYYSQTPEAKILPRPVERPSGTAGPIFDYYDRFGCGQTYACGCNDSADAASVIETASPATSGGPFEAPWKHLPAVCTTKVELNINVVRPKVEVTGKGVLIDLFI